MNKIRTVDVLKTIQVMNKYMLDGTMYIVRQFKTLR